MSKRKDKNPNGKTEHQERLNQNSNPQEITSEEPNGISSPKLINRSKFRGNVPKMRALTYRPNQQNFIDCLQKPDTKIVVLTGPAGTGKTLLAVRKGLEGVLNGRFADLVLCRPLVEAGGEELGFLPGGVDDKIGPYLEPFYDKLTAFLPETLLKNLLNAKHITATPLAYMRGRTFSESLVIIDEAQNTTVEQIKMAVTRLGPFSKMVICGDLQQSDIRGMNGLEYLTQLFTREGTQQAESNGCYLCQLGIEDIQRNCVIPYLIEAFTRFKPLGAESNDKKKILTPEAQFANFLKKAMRHITNDGRERAPRYRGPRLVQADLFEIPPSPVMNS